MCLTCLAKKSQPRRQYAAFSDLADLGWGEGQTSEAPACSWIQPQQEVPGSWAQQVGIRETTCGPRTADEGRLFKLAQCLLYLTLRSLPGPCQEYFPLVLYLLAHGLLEKGHGDESRPGTLQ